MSLAESATSTPILHFCRACVEAMLSNFALVAGQVVTLLLLMGGGLCPGPVGEAVSRRGLPDVHPGPLRGHPRVIIHAFAIERTDGMVRLLLEFAAV